MSEALAQAYASASEDDPILECLEFYHSALTETVRIVNDHSPLTAKLETSAPRNANQFVMFTPVRFEMALPSESISSKIPEISVTVGNSSLILSNYIEKIASSFEKIQMVYRYYMQSDLNIPAINPPYSFNVTSVSANSNSVSIRANMNLLNNSKFPKLEYTAKNFRQLVSR
jgi:hypothetical protein